MHAGRQRLPVLADFVLQQRAGASLWVARKYAKQGFMDRLVDADGLFADPSCQVIKDQRKIKVARLVVDIDGKFQGLFVKRYNMFSLRHKLVSGLVHSGALRALRGAAILREAGIETATPVAAVENRKRGSLDKSFYITEELSGGKTVDAYWCEILSPLGGADGRARRRKCLTQLAQLFRQLHERAVYNNDLKDANILALSDQPGGVLRLYLLDLEGVRRYSKLNTQRKIKNLVQINRTLGKYLRVSEKLIFLKSYLDRSYNDRKVRRQFIAVVNRESVRLDATKKS